MPPAETSNPARRRNGSKHDKTGCLTCRYRRKKCAHNSFPVCGDCSRLNLECIRVPARQVVPVTTNPAPSFGDVEYDQRRSAMNFYITILSQLLTVTEKENSFLSAFLPMAMESPTLRDALVAWSAGHLALRDDRYRSTALEARSRALRSLARSLPAHASAAGEINAATGLVLMTSEVCLGYPEEWYRHLIGVKHIIMSTRSSNSSPESEMHGPEALKQSSEGRWILRNFAYHDILGSVTLGKQPLIGSHFLQGLSDTMDTYVGVGFEILMIISDTSSIEEQCLVYDYMRPHETDTSVPNHFSSLERRLKAWQHPPGANPALISLAYAYRSSALIYLYRRTLSGLKLQSVVSQRRYQDCLSALGLAIQAEVSIILQHTASIPLSGIVESALLFPLFIAGGETIDRNHREIIRSRMKGKLCKRDFNNIQQALGVLEKVWEKRNAAGEEICDVCWRDIVSRQKGGLLLT